MDISREHVSKMPYAASFAVEGSQRHLSRVQVPSKMVNTLRWSRFAPSNCAFQRRRGSVGILRKAAEREEVRRRWRALHPQEYLPSLLLPNSIVATPRSLNSLLSVIRSRRVKNVKESK